MNVLIQRSGATVPKRIKKKRDYCMCRIDVKKKKKRGVPGTIRSERQRRKALKRCDLVREGRGGRSR